MTLIDFTLSNARRVYSSMGNPLAVKGLTTSKTMSPLRVSCIGKKFTSYPISALALERKMGSHKGREKL